MNGQQMPGWDFAYAWDEYLNLYMCLLRMLEDTFSLGVAYLKLSQLN